MIYRGASDCKKAIVVASGPSASDFSPPDGIVIIAVNGAIEWLSRADYFFTLDPSEINLRRIYNPVARVKYTAAVPFDIRLPCWVQRFERIDLQQDEPPDKYSPHWWLWRWSAVCRLSEDKKSIHTGNSAWGALGLAYHLGFTDIALVGVDATSDPRIEGGMPQNLTHLPLLFSSALDQVNVVSCGELNGIPKVSLKEWLDD